MLETHCEHGALRMAWKLWVLPVTHRTLICHQHSQVLYRTTHASAYTYMLGQILLEECICFPKSNLNVFIVT